MSSMRESIAFFRSSKVLHLFQAAKIKSYRASEVAFSGGVMDALNVVDDWASEEAGASSVTASGLGS